MIRTLRRALAAATLAAASLTASAAAPQVGGASPGFARTQIGDAEITALSDGSAVLPVDQLLLNISPERISQALAYHHLAVPTPTSFNGFLVNTGGKLILIDAGAGQFFGPTLGKLADNLKAAGYQPEQVDEIYLTHLHPDHVGGLLRHGERVFPNAVVRADQQEVDYWLSEANLSRATGDDKGFFESATAALAPYRAAGKLQTFSGDTNLAPTLRAVVTHGHTPGHTIYVLESKGKKMVFWGDLIHVAAVQFSHPAVAIKFDVDPRNAVRQRKLAFDAAAKDGYAAAAAHLAFPGIGYVQKQKNGTGYEWIPLPPEVR